MHPRGFQGCISREGRRRQAGSLSWALLFLIFSLLPSADCLAEVVTSRAAVAIDASTGEVLFSKNSSDRLPPASTTKLMTALLTMEKEDLSRVVTISRNAAHVGPTRAGFREGDKVTIEGLLYAALIGSANDAAVGLAEAVAGSEKRFVRLMNEKAAALGAWDTKFINANGLPGPGQHTTAIDLSILMSHAMRYPKLRDIVGTPGVRIITGSGRNIYLKNTDKMLWVDEKVIGGKTGYTRSARHCFVCAARNDARTIIVALLGSPSRQQLWMDTERLIALGLQGSPV